MATYKASYDFPQDPDCIYEILSEVECMSQFMPMCKRSQVLSRQTTEDAEVVRANFLLRYRRLDFELEFDMEVTMWPADRRIKLETSDTTYGSATAHYLVTGVGRTGTRVLFETDYRAKGLLFRLFLGRRLVRRGMDRIMERVRQRAETMPGL